MRRGEAFVCSQPDAEVCNRSRFCCRAFDRFVAARLYAITCTPVQGAAGYPAMVRAACEGGVDILQFRDKVLAWKEKFEVGQELRKICAAFNTLFIINDATDLAAVFAKSGYDVVLLSQAKLNGDAK